MKKTQRFEKRLAAARENCREVMETYREQESRMKSSKNGFVRACCQQTIDQLRAEKAAIEEEIVG